MAKRNTPASNDPDLAAIANLERAIVAAFDERHAFAATPAVEIARVRPGVVALAASIGERLRCELEERRRQPS